MTKEKQHYRIPVYDINWDDKTIEIRTITEDEAAEADEYLSVEHRQPENADPELEVVHVTPDQEDTYRFRVQDEDLKECTYVGDDLDDVTHHVQHVVAHQEYGINGLCRRDSALFLWMEGVELLYATEDLEDLYENFPMMLAALTSLVDGMKTLTLSTLARFALPPTTYWNCWHEVAGQPAELDEKTMIRTGKRFLDEIAQVEDHLNLKHAENGVFAVPAALKTDTVRRDDEAYLLIDTIAEWGAHRFRFSIQNDDECVFEGPDEVRLPPFVKDQVEQCGYEIRNRPTLAHTKRPSQILQQYGNWCQRADHLGLIPDDTTGPLAEPLRLARVEVQVLSSILEFFEEEPMEASRIHQRLCVEHDVERPEAISEDEFSEMAAKMLRRMPDRYHPLS